MKYYIVKEYVKMPLEDGGTQKHFADMSPCFETHEEAEEFANKIEEIEGEEH